jgi:hypothetical protein
MARVKSGNEKKKLQPAPAKNATTVIEVDSGDDSEDEDVYEPTTLAWKR